MKELDILKESFSKIPTEIHREIDLSFDIVNRIHEILARQGRSQKDLAQILGKKESEISKWLRGTHNFTIRTISKLSAALGEDILRVYNPEEKWRKMWISLSYDSTIPIDRNGSPGKMICNIPGHDMQVYYLKGNDNLNA